MEGQFFAAGPIIVRAILAGGTINLSQSGSIMRPSPSPQYTWHCYWAGQKQRREGGRRGESEKTAFHSKQAG